MKVPEDQENGVIISPEIKLRYKSIIVILSDRLVY
jgi:hypothetical protein